MLVRRNSDTPYQGIGVRPKASPAVMPTAVSASQTSTISSSPPATTMATATVTNGVNTSRVETTESFQEHPALDGDVPKEPSRISLSLSKLLPLIGRDVSGNSSGNGAHGGHARNIDQTIQEGGSRLQEEGAAAGDHPNDAEDRQDRTQTDNSVNTRDEEAVWQEDGGVKACPLCDTKFTFFNRRHHCRKCGKIFCNKCCGKFCTFIPGSSVVEPEEEGGRTIVRNGYQYYKFRTCEKCHQEIKMLKEALGIADDSEEDSREEETEEEDETAEGDGDDNESFERHLSIMGEDRSGNGSGPEWRRSRRRTRARTRTRTRRETSIEGSGRSQGGEGDDADAESLMCLIKHSQPREITMEVSESRVREADGSTGGDRAGEGFPQGNVNTNIEHGSGNHIHNHNHNNNNSELNECPVCGIDIGGVSEAERETHINRCLTDQEFGSPTHPGDVAKRDKNRMLVYSIPADADMAHMVLNDDNECVICLEEFSPGDKLGRLECLCCFHYKCIKDWIRKKGYCECPIHALHAQ